MKALSCWLAVASLAFAPAAGAAREVVSGPTFKYAIDPAVPAWVKRVETPQAPPSQRAPWHYGLIDSQVQIGARPTERHTHIVRRIVDPTGLAEASQILIYFDPSYQTLTLHELVLIRDQKRISKLAKGNIRVLQREENLEQQIYDGMVTLSVVLDDARAGDAVEYRYTVAGSNPVFENRFLHGEWMRGFRAPAALVHARVVHPKSRQIRHRVADKSVGVRESESGAEKEVVLTARDTAMIEALPDLPPDYFMQHVAGFSEYPDWQAVAAWGTRTFAKALGRSERIAAQAASLRAGGGTPAELAARALDFVQRDIRYLGVELGENSHLPNPADKVLAQRYGDCKDKSVLLIALLQELGVTAYPVLVSTRNRRFVRDDLASPNAFNHAIVGVELEGRTYWVDPTRQFESGQLEARQASEFGAGLPLRAGVSELAAAPARLSAPLLASFRDEITVKAFSQPAALAARATFFGPSAQRVMGAWSGARRAELEKEFVGEYARRYVGARHVGAVRVLEEPKANSARVEADFELPELFGYPEENQLVASVFLWGFIAELRPGFDSARARPLYLGEQRRVSHTIVLRLPEPVVRDPQDYNSRVDDPHFSFLHRIWHDTRTINFQADVELRADTVPAERWPQFHRNVVETGNRYTNYFRFSPVPLGRRPELERALQALDKDFADGRSRWATLSQVRSESSRLVLTEHLDSGRLTPRQRSSALLARSLSLNQTDRAGDALVDVKLALRDSPQLPGGLLHLSVVHLGRGDFADSLQTATQYLEAAPGSPGAHAVIGRNHFHLGRYELATRHFLESARRASGDGRTIAVSWAILSERRAGRDVQRIVQEFPLADSDDRFAHHVLRFVSGRMAEADLMGRAKNHNRSVEVSQQCEAFFYVAMAQLIANDPAAARRSFERSLGTRVYEYLEYTSAKLELAKLR